MNSKKTRHSDGSRKRAKRKSRDKFGKERKRRQTLERKRRKKELRSSRLPIVDEYTKMRFQYFPEFFYWLSQVTDFRKGDNVRYSISVLISVVIAMFILKLGARRQIALTLKKNEKSPKLQKLINSKDVPHGHTVKNEFIRLKEDEVENVRINMVTKLNRMKVLEDCKLYGYHLLAIDASQMVTFKKRHCPHCLTRTINKGKKNEYTQYFHYILDARIVNEHGLAIGIATEHVENPDAAFDKQDCELKAFYRLEKKIKQRYPDMKFCVLLDGLYAKEPVMKICDDNGWKFIIVLKDGSLKTVNREFDSLIDWSLEAPGNDPDIVGMLRRRESAWNSDQELTWVNAIDYKGLQLNVLNCVETRPDNETSHWRWITNFDTTKDTAPMIANKGGRMRWKIENQGYNTLKNHGYNLEHLYCKDLNAMKIFLIIMNIAHILDQLLLLKFPTGKLISFWAGSFQNIWREMMIEIASEVDYDASFFQQLDLLCDPAPG